MKFALGARGERPVRFVASLTYDQVQALTQIPGVARVSGGLSCTWDVAPILAAALGVSCPPIPTEANATEDELRVELNALPGLERYRSLGFPTKLRPYQKEGAFFLARRAYAMNSDPMRSGKSAMALAATVLVDATRILILCPALAKYVWADECAKWTQEQSLILEGRGGDRARLYCLACMGRGFVDTNGKRGRCAKCRMRNGQSRGFKLYGVCTWARDAAGAITSRCRKHPGEEADIPSVPNMRVACLACKRDLRRVIRETRYIICNYDIVVASKISDAAGQLHLAENLPGWGPVLGEFTYDLAILDESHLLRGFSTSASRKGQTRRERVAELVDPIPQVHALTGTPVFGFVRDLWGQFDIISKGAMTGNGRGERLPFTWHAAYCEGHKDEYGWRADGRSVRADSELPVRLPVVKIQRPRSQILAQMPAKIRQVVRIDADKQARKRIVRSRTPEANFATLLGSTLAIKLDTVVENVLLGAAQGEKSIVFVYLRDSASKVMHALEAAAAKHDVRTRMREVGFKVWAVHGDTTPQGRFEHARGFREHVGAGVFVATIDAVQVAVSLKGAASVHFADLHWQPAALLQAEDRPYEVGTTGLSIVYYIVRDSVDEVIESNVLPKVRTLADLIQEKGADELRTALMQVGSVSLSELISEMMQDVDLSLGAYDDEEDGGA